MSPLSSSLRRFLCFSTLLAAVLASRPALPQAPAWPPNNYFVKAVCESSDRIVTVRFGPDGAKVQKSVETGLMPSDMDGPHGIAFSPDRDFYYVSIAHGRPYGSAWKYSAKDDAVLGRVTLGLFPATEDVSPDGNFLYVVNFNLHGDPAPSSVSVVNTNVMLEMARIPTCVMPHGSRVSRDGTRHYSACMMDDLLVEIDAERMKVARSFRLTAGAEKGYQGMPQPATHQGHAMGRGDAPPKPDDASCSPTWAQPSVDGKRVYVACNKSSEIVELDTAEWSVVRRMPAGTGVYNLAVTPDGARLIATNKRGASVSVFDVETRKEVARLPTKRKVPHGVTVSPDSRYAFVTVEGIGSEPGTIEVLDLLELKTVAIVDTPPQAAGIDFWKREPLP